MKCATCKTIFLFVFRSICLEGQMLYQCSVENSKHGLYLAKLNTLEILENKRDDIMITVK